MYSKRKVGALIWQKKITKTIKTTKTKIVTKITTTMKTAIIIVDKYKKRKLPVLNE